MIRSMTGYGKGEYSDGSIAATVEIKAVNHRYFEFSARAPRVYSFLEEKIKSNLVTKVSRGKVEAFITIETESQDDTVVETNKAFTAEYIQALRQLACDYDINDDISVMSVARNNDVFFVKKRQFEDDAIWAIVECATNSAVSAFIQMKEIEGTRLYEDIESRVNLILTSVDFIERRSPETVSAYREKLESKIREILSDKSIDEQRLLTEVAIFADKVAVSEETVRLRSHMEQLIELIKVGGAIGRKLDFIVQEMNRETNTIGSKAQDIEITRTVVEIKSEIEKIREQIQNIE